MELWVIASTSATAVTGFVLGILAVVDWTQIIVGAVATVGVIGAALANNRGRKQEKITTAVSTQADINNALIDQLQESLLDYRSENQDLRAVVQAQGLELAEIRGHLDACHAERDELRRLVEGLTK